MNQVIEQTYEQQVNMYSKCTKAQLIDMLIQCNKYTVNIKSSIMESKTDEKVLSGTCTTAGCVSMDLGMNGTVTTDVYQWSHPERVEVNEYGDRIEIIYKQTSMFTYTTFHSPAPSPEVRVFKIVFSCKDGKWHKSEPVFGQIIPKQKEWYQFKD